MPGPPLRRFLTVALGAVLVLFNVLGAFAMPVAQARTGGALSPWDMICSAEGVRDNGASTTEQDGEQKKGTVHGSICTMCLPLAHGALLPSPGADGTLDSLTLETSFLTLAQDQHKPSRWMAVPFGRAPPIA
ncbi:DUF2946 family protein [Dongia sp.]|uniref:DUF2946 family protein n=1 Tax=Dongia sp. TaxID=1977262 RepID=UPI0035B212CB